MSIANRHRYKTRREKNATVLRNIKVAVIIALIAGVVYVIKNRVYLMDYFQTYFY